MFLVRALPIYVQASIIPLDNEREDYGVYYIMATTSTELAPFSLHSWALRDVLHR